MKERLCYWTAERDDVLKRAWPTGRTLKDMSRAWRIPIAAISSRARQLGLEPRKSKHGTGRAPSINIRFHLNEAEQYRKAAQRRGVSLSGLIRSALRCYLGEPVA